MRLYKYSFWTFSLWLRHPSIDIPVTVITIVSLLMILYFPYSFHICKSDFFCKGKLFSFSAYVFIYLCLCRLPDISFILWIIVQTIIYFICLNCFHFLSLGALLDWLLLLLEKPSSFFKHVLVFWHHKMFQAHLVFSNPGINCRNPEQWYQRMYLETKIWAVGVALLLRICAPRSS